MSRGRGALLGAFRQMQIHHGQALTNKIGWCKRLRALLGFADCSLPRVAGWALPGRVRCKRGRALEPRTALPPVSEPSSAVAFAALSRTPASRLERSVSKPGPSSDARAEEEPNCAKPGQTNPCCIPGSVACRRRSRDAGLRSVCTPTHAAGGHLAVRSCLQHQVSWARRKCTG